MQLWKYKQTCCMTQMRGCLSHFGSQAWNSLLGAHSQVLPIFTIWLLCVFRHLQERLTYIAELDLIVANFLGCFKFLQQKGNVVVSRWRAATNWRFLFDNISDNAATQCFGSHCAQRVRNNQTWTIKCVVFATCCGCDMPKREITDRKRKLMKLSISGQENKNRAVVK